MSSRVLWVSLVAGFGLCASVGHAQATVVRTLRVSATATDVGGVVSVAPLQWTGSAEMSTAMGSVGTKYNAPYLLQARLTSAQPDTVLARLPDGSFGPLGTIEWTTVATGSAGSNSVNTVEYRIQRVKGDSDLMPPDAFTIPMAYRVVRSP